MGIRREIGTNEMPLVTESGQPKVQRTEWGDTSFNGSGGWKGCSWGSRSSWRRSRCALYMGKSGKVRENQ